MRSIKDKYYNIYYDSVPAAGKKVNEDYIRVEKNEKDGHIIIIADGVSSSLMPSHWAKILVDNIIYSPSSEYFLRNFKSAVNEFNVFLEQKKSIGSRLFLEKIKRDKYGSSTILVCNLNKDSLDGSNIGDTIPFILSGNKIEFLNEYLHKQELDKLVPNQVMSKIDQVFKCIDFGPYKKSGIFFLATDAVAHMIRHKDKVFADKLIDALKKDKFNKFIEDKRFNGEIQNDDSSIVVIEIK